MRSSIVLATLMGVLAVASPVRHEKRVLVTDIVTDIVYVTVTLDPHSTSQHPKTVKIKHTVTVGYTSSSSTSSSSSTIEPTTPPPPPPTPTPEPAPPAPTPEPAPVVETPPPAPVAPKPLAAPAPVAPSGYAAKAVFHHNAHRANHSAGALSWDDTLAAYALNTAKSCVFAHDMSQGGGGYGQNLAAYGTSSNIGSLDLSNAVADSITNQWYYGEYLNMHYGQDSPQQNGGEFLHFTQVVWKSTTRVGCATVQCPSGSIFGMPSLYTVCDYASQGNVMGSFISQVSPPVGNAGISASI